MAVAKTRGQGKSEFIKGVLSRDPEATMKGVIAAWKKAGHPGTISNPLYYKIRSAMKGAGTGTKPTANGSNATSTASGKPKMAAAKKRGPKKSAFVRELLVHNPDVNEKSVNAAWKAAGNPGTISGTLLYLIRNETKNKAAKQHANAAIAAPPVPHANGRRAASGSSKGTLEEFEADIDRLIFKIMGIGGLSAVEEALRQARRLIVRHG
jgi:hypothetical protein